MRSIISLFLADIPSIIADRGRDIYYLNPVERDHRHLRNQRRTEVLSIGRAGYLLLSPPPSPGPARDCSSEGAVWPQDGPKMLQDDPQITQHEPEHALVHQISTNTRKSRIPRNLRGDRHLREVRREDMLDVRGPLNTKMTQK